MKSEASSMLNTAFPGEELDGNQPGKLDVGARIRSTPNDDSNKPLLPDRRTPTDKSDDGKCDSTAKKGI